MVYLCNVLIITFHVANVVRVPCKHKLLEIVLLFNLFDAMIFCKKKHMLSVWKTAYKWALQLQHWTRNQYIVVYTSKILLIYINHLTPSVTLHFDTFHLDVISYYVNCYVHCLYCFVWGSLCVQSTIKRILTDVKWLTFMIESKCITRNVYQQTTIEIRDIVIYFSLNVIWISDTVLFLCIDAQLSQSYMIIPWLTLCALLVNPSCL